MITTFPSDEPWFHPAFIFRHPPTLFHSKFIFQQRFAAHSHASSSSSSDSNSNSQAQHTDAAGRAGEFIATVDVWQLNELNWPIMRVFTPGYVDHLELDHYLKHLLDSRQWREVYAVPHTDAQRRSKHVFDIYGQRR